MSYANFVLYSSVIPNPPRYDKDKETSRDKQPKRSGMTFSELLGTLKQMPM